MQSVTCNPFQPMNSITDSSDPLRMMCSRGIIGADPSLTYMVLRAIAARHTRKESRFGIWHRIKDVVCFGIF